MVPRSTILRRIPSVDKLGLRGNGALREAIHTVHVHGLPLPDAMPVDTSSVVSKRVVHVDFYGISPAGFNKRTRPGVIEDSGFTECQSVGVNSVVRNVEIVYACDAFKGNTLIVSRDVVFLACLGITQPTALVVGSSTWLEARHVRIVADEFIDVAAGRPEDGMPRFDTVDVRPRQAKLSSYWVL